MVLFLQSKKRFCYIPENESEHPVLGWNKSRTLRRSPKTLISHFQNVPRPKSRPKDWKNRRENDPNSGGKTRRLYGSNPISIDGNGVCLNLRNRMDKPDMQEIIYNNQETRGQIPIWFFTRSRMPRPHLYYKNNTTHSTQP